MKAKFRFRIFIFSFLTIIFFSSCNPHFYKPKPLAPVLLTKKDQLKLNAITDFGMNSISLAYSPIKNFGVQLGSGLGHYKSSGSVNGRDTIYLDENYFNPFISAGYYKNVSPNILFETYAGAGLYNYKNSAPAYVKNMQTTNIFIQPSIAAVKNNFETVFTVRLDYLKRNKTIITNRVLSADDQMRYKFLDYSNYFFIQPGATIKAGSKSVKFQFQVSENICLSKNYNTIYGYSYQLLVFNNGSRTNKMLYSFGATFELDNIFKK